MKTKTIKKVLTSLTIGTYLTMILTLFYVIISRNENLFYNGTIGIETLFICFTLTVISGILLKLTQ